MPLKVNLRHLERQDVVLKGELPVAELDLEMRDEMIQAQEPLKHHLTVQQMDEALLIRGRLTLPLHCQCVRCLKPFVLRLDLKDWNCLIPLSGEEAAPQDGDTVDLTPFLREDILLELPQHPLCKTDCGGLKKPSVGKSKKRGAEVVETSTIWAELDKIKFRKE